MENKVLKAIINSQKENDSENVDINVNDNSSNKSFFNNFDLNDESFGLVNVKVFGIGGAGCNAIKYILDKKPNIPKNISTYAINTDAKALKRLNNLTNQIVIGKDLLKGLGAGANPIIGKQAAIESEADIRKILTNTPTDILFIIAGMGKGTGSGASPEIARIAKELGIMTIGIINFPSLKAEGNMVLQNAHEHFNNLNHYLTSYTLISNDKIIDNADNCVGYYDAFERANDQIAHIIISTVELINGSSEQNIDFSDIKTFFNRNHIFQWGKFTFDNKTNKETILQIIEDNVRNSVFDVLLEDKNTTMLVAAKINHQTLSTFKNEIKESFSTITGDNNLSIVYDISYQQGENVDICYLISATESSKQQTTFKNINHPKVDIDEFLFGNNSFKKIQTANNTSFPTRNSTKVIKSNKIINQDIEISEISSSLSTSAIKNTKTLN